MAIALILFVVALIGLSMGVLANETEPQEVVDQTGMWRFDFTEGDGSGVIASCANPEGADVYIKRALCVVTTVATAAATLDIGIGTSISDDDDTLFDGLDVNSAAGVFDNLIAHGTNGLAGKIWLAENFLTIKEASGDVTGLVGYMLIEYTRISGL